MALRWKKDRESTGCINQKSSTLSIDGQIRVATVMQLGKCQDAWYWIAGWDHPGIPHKNTWKETPQAESAAKACAAEYVREHITRHNASRNRWTNSPVIGLKGD
ncbi:hypothetical protein [Rhodoferax antarcticus]|uniref:hypothetical protein n=1 Tax=Rhodoferax antarcticus TaxID=81479 RepID=UPI0011152820|nr:hypothetical protein [Rhodoferax antarcticus]